MFWPVDPSASNEEAKSWRRYPWGTGTILLLLFLSFVWSRWGLSQRTLEIAQKKEELACFYLKNDFTTLSYPIQAELPPVLLAHHQRIQPILNEYYSDITAARQAREWLQESDLRGMSSLATEPDDPKDKRPCVQKAIQIGQFGRHPKRRIFVTLAGMQESTVQAQRDKLDVLIKEYFDRKQAHPFYGLGLIPSARQSSAILTSLFVQPAWWTLLWMMVFLWIAGAMLEIRWRQPGWIGWFLGSGLLANLILFFGMHRQSVLLLGMQGALAGLMGLWLVVSGLGKVKLQAEIPRLLPRKEIVLPGFAIAGAWFFFHALDSLALQGLPVGVFAVWMLLFGLSAGIAYALQYFGIWLIPESESEDKNFLESTWQVQRREQQRSAHQEQELLEKAKSAMDDARYREAAAFYRQAIGAGFGNLQVIEGLLTACEKSGQAVRSEEYMRAIRAALFEKREERVAPLFHQYKRSQADADLSARDRLGLATDLRKARMYREAAEEADIVLEKGPDDPFYMKALFIRADSILDIGEDPEAAIRLLHQGENYLERYPEYRTTLEKTRQRADRVLAGEPAPSPTLSSAALQPLAVSSAALQTLSMPGIKNAPKSSAALPTLSSPKTGAGLPTIQLPGIPAHLAPSAKDDKLNLGADLDFDLYDDFQQQQGEQANSWEEIPLLLLKEKGEASDKDKPASMFAPGSKKETKTAVEVEAAIPKGDWWDDEDSRPLKATAPPKKPTKDVDAFLGSPFSADEIASAGRSSSSKPTSAKAAAFDDFESAPLSPKKPTPAKVAAFDDFEPAPLSPQKTTPAKADPFEKSDSLLVSPAKEDIFESFEVQSSGEDPQGWASDWGLEATPAHSSSKPPTAQPLRKDDSDVFELTEIVEETPPPSRPLLSATAPSPLGSLLSSQAGQKGSPLLSSSPPPPSRSLLSSVTPAPASPPSAPLTTRPLGTPSLLGARIGTPAPSSEDKNKPLVSQQWLTERRTKKPDEE